jgi:hypothetical protein
MVRLENEANETGVVFYAAWSRTHRRVDCCGAWHGKRRSCRPSARNGLEQGAFIRPACWLLGPPISALRPLRRSPCRGRGPACGRAATSSGGAARGRGAAGYRPTAAPGKLRRISLLERPILRRCALQQALSRTEAVTRISARLGRVLEVILDLLDDQAPSLVLARACGLLHRDLQIAELALDLLTRQHMQAAR